MLIFQFYFFFSPLSFKLQKKTNLHIISLGNVFLCKSLQPPGHRPPQVPDRVPLYLLSVFKVLFKEAIMSQHPAHVSAASGEVRAKALSVFKNAIEIPLFGTHKNKP